MRVKSPINQLRTLFERRKASIHIPTHQRNSGTSLHVAPDGSHNLDYQKHPNRWSGKSIFIKARYNHTQCLQQTDLGRSQKRHHCFLF